MSVFQTFLNIGKNLQYYNSPKFMQDKNCAVGHLWLFLPAVHEK